MRDLSRVKDREVLKTRREPYWQRLRPGCFLGYRVAKRGGAGSWIARAYDGTARKYRLRALGSFGEKPANERFAAAKHETERFAAEVESGSLREEQIRTVEDACRRFAQSRLEVRNRFRRYVYSEPLAKVELSKLRRSHVASWRAALEAKPVMVSRRKHGEPVTRSRSPATLNRDMAALRTALGAVLSLGAPNTDAAWQEALKPVKHAVKRRTLYLSLDERRRLLEAIADDAKSFVRTLCLLPLRPGAVAALRTHDYDKLTAELTIGKDKSGNNRRIKVPPGAAEHFATAAKDKLPAALLFTRPNGKPWDKDTWKGPISEATHTAKLPPAVTAYTLRHSTITDLVGSGLPLLTIAQISGTSAEMIERHYGHLARDAATEALAGLAV